MTDTPKFTVILAGYQTAPYLPKALGSIAEQTFTNFEAICYVEESTDDSLAICRAVAEKDARFNVISAPKSGAVATTRNYGIDHAKGEYLVVLDGDDWIRLDMLERLADKIEEIGPVDVLAYAAVTTESETVDLSTASRISNFKASDANEKFSGIEAIRRSGRNGGSIWNYTWLNAYRTAFLRAARIHQTDGVLMEDMESTPRIWFAAQTFAYLDEALYIYRRRPNSLTTERSGRIAIDTARQFRSLSNFADTREIPADIVQIWSNQWLSVLYWFLFHPVTSRKISDGSRTRALNTLLAEYGVTKFKRIVSFASMQKRLASFFVILAWRGWQFPAKFFFRKIFYPLAEHRARRKA